MDKKDRFLFRIIIRPRELDHLKGRNWITDLLQLKPTGGHELGDITTTAKYSSAKQYDYWSWEYSTDWQDYSSDNDGISFSHQLMDFLQTLPSSKIIWQQLNEFCKCSLFISFERSRLLSEIKFENDIWPELTKRSLSLEMSSLFIQNK